MSKDILNEMILEQLEPKLRELLGIEESLDMLQEKGPAPSKVDKSADKVTLTATFDAIPTVNISELGWLEPEAFSSNRSIDPSDRKIVMGYLKNIAPKGGVVEKLKSLENFYSAPLKEVVQEPRIHNIMSYLVFYKTFTRIFANFGDKPSGFIAESFFGAFLGGSQIPTDENRIVDFYDSKGKHYSMKTLAQGSQIDGSVNNLIRDILDFGEVPYIIAIKYLTSETEGFVRFYKFTFDLDSIVEPDFGINIKFPKDYESYEFAADQQVSQDADDWTAELRKDRKRDIEELKNYISLTAELGTTGGKSAPMNFKLATANSIINDHDKSGYKENLKNRGIEFPDDILDKAYDIFFRKEFKDAKGTAGKNRAINSVLRENKNNSELLGNEQYKKLDNDQKIKALRWRLANKEQFKGKSEKRFSINQATLLSKAKARGENEINNNGDGLIAEIPVGARRIEKVLENIINEINNNIEDINSTIFSIAQDVNIMTKSINEYFASNLTESGQADQAIDHSMDFTRKTTEVREKQEASAPKDKQN